MMRSRYTAYAIRDRDYLLATWHPSTRPSSLVFDPEVEWFRLDILGRTGGGLLDDTGTVEFRAHFRSANLRHSQFENSRFVRIDKAWVYLDKV